MFTRIVKKEKEKKMRKCALKFHENLRKCSLKIKKPAKIFTRIKKNVKMFTNIFKKICENVQ